MLKWASAFVLNSECDDAAIENEVVSHFKERLYDFEEKVRVAAVAAVSDIAEVKPSAIDGEMLRSLGERMRDKRASVRHPVMKRLGAVYRAYRRSTRRRGGRPPRRRRGSIGSRARC